MSRNEFISELKTRLRKLPYDEVTEAVNYYEEYFDDAGAENEQAVLAELGSPAAVAAQIITSSAVKSVDEQKSAKKSWQSAWLVILALFASPVALPLAIAVGAVALALVISLSAVIFSFFAAGIAMLAGGVACVIAGILVITQSFATTLYVIGAGLALLGAGTATVIATMALAKICFGWLTRLVSRFVLKNRRDAK